MKYLALFILFSSSAFGQVFKLDSLPKQGVLLDKGWKWHVGDNLDYSKADFEDNQWESIDPTLDIYYLKQIREAEMGWIRLQIWVDSSLVKKPLAFNLIQNGAHEIYLNGTLITQIGVVNKDLMKEVTYTSNGRPYSLYFDKAGLQYLAVRYSFSRKNHLNNHRGIGNYFFRAEINQMDSSISSFLASQYLYSILDYGKCGFFLFMGILHLSLFFFFKSNKANLYFGLYGLVVSVLFYFNSIVIMPEDFQVLYWYKIFAIGLSMSCLILALLSTYSYVNEKKGIAFWCIILIALTGIPVFLSTYIWGSLYALVFVQLCFCFENGRVSFIAMKGGNQRALFLMLGWILYSLFFGTYMMIALQILNLPTWVAHVTSNLSFLAVPICYTLLLSSDFGRTNKVLMEKLIENERLSAQAIAQEQEKHELLATQNETLERKVTERTEALNQSLENLKQTQAQLIQKEKLASLGELTAGIAHEIQNPLNFVNNFSELSVELVKDLKDEMGKPDIDKEYIGELFDDLSINQEKINHHGKRASSIVKGMLEHSRSSTGERILTDINQLADEYLRLSYHGMKAKNKDFFCDFQTDFDENLPKIEVILQDIGRVLLNLFNNAFYAANTNVGKVQNLANVKVCTEKSDNQVIIKVKDNGNGIPKANLEKIFQPFFTTKPTGEGTGLGLSLSYDIITKGHGGTLTVESIEGEGAEFIIRLPINQIIT